MTLDQWLSHLEQLHPSTIELGLERVNQVANKLCLDLSDSRVIIVGGTNGKGSTVALLSTILGLAGKSTACYTSPHISIYNERVCLNNEFASDQQLCDAFSAVEKARNDIRLTYFEFGTLAALYIFAQEKPDYAILEVGLGGRLDAVNIVDPVLCILTNVALDHIDWLGDTREKIGFEKAGIFRENIPVIYGEVDIPDSVQKHAEFLSAPIYKQAVHFLWTLGEDASWSWQGIDGSNNTVNYFNLPKTDIHLDNAASALQALALLESDLDESTIRQGLMQVKVTGRFEVLESHNNKATVVLDVAHNPHAAQNLVQTIKGRFPGNNLHVVLAMLEDKDLSETSNILSQLDANWYIGRIQDERGAPAKILYNYLVEQSAEHIACFESVEQALDAAIIDADAQDVILVTGSFFTIAVAQERFKEWG